MPEDSNDSGRPLLSSLHSIGSERLGRNDAAVRRNFKRCAALLLALKVCANAYEYQMKAYTDAASSGVNCTGDCQRSDQPPTCLLRPRCFASAAAAFVTPVLGGILVDTALLGDALTVLWLGAGLQMAGYCFVTTMDRLNLMCHLPVYLLSWMSVLLSFCVTDVTLIHTLLQQNPRNRSRQILLQLYFAAAAAGELIGNSQGALRYFGAAPIGYEAIGLTCTLACLVCMFRLTRADPYTDRVPFELPRPMRMHRFYLIVAGTIPHLAGILTCRLSLYWQQLRYFSRAETAEQDFIVSYVGFIGYQAATILLSGLAALAIAAGWVPARLTLRLRIRAGLGFVAVSKVPLVLISGLDYAGTINLEALDSLSLWGIYLGFAVCDGVCNVLATTAVYELVYRIANTGSKATMVGIFYTVWGLAILLNGALLQMLQWLGVLSLELTDRTKPKSHYAYAAVIGLLVIAIAYWEKISWPLASGLVAENDEELAEDGNTAEGPLDG